MKELVVFGEDFGKHPSSTQHLILQLSHQYRILWVNSIGLRQPQLTLKDSRRVINKLYQFYSSLLAKFSSSQTSIPNNHPDNIQVITLMTIPAPTSYLARKLATQLMYWQLKRHLIKNNYQNPILWSSLPTAAEICRKLSNNKIIYYCGDDFSALAGVDHQTAIQHEKIIQTDADLILTASKVLSQKFPPHKTKLLTHGVDYELFNQPTLPAIDLPNGGHRVVGFYGSLSNWLDYELIHQVATQMSDWQFVFIGQCELTTFPLTDQENIHYLGTRDHHLLPTYSQYWQVSWLPFIDNQQIRACNPLKLLEYIAVKTPIISTTFPAVTAWKEKLPTNQIHLVQTAEEICLFLTSLTHEHRLQTSIADEANPQSKTSISPQKSSSSNMAMVERESWQNRAQQLHQWIEQL